jgi:hypothetical protein
MEILPDLLKQGTFKYKRQFLHGQCVIIVQCRPVIRKPDIRKSGYKKGAGRVPAELLFVIT